METGYAEQQQIWLTWQAGMLSCQLWQRMPLRWVTSKHLPGTHDLKSFFSRRWAQYSMPWLVCSSKILRPATKDTESPSAAMMTTS